MQGTGKFKEKVMKENRSKKRYGLIVLLALVIAASGSVAVGVAGYVIGGNANGDDGAVSINAGSAEVGDITVKGTVEDDAIYFAGKSKGTVAGSNGKVISWDEDDTEDLDASINFVSDETNNAFELNHHYTIALTTTIDSSVFAETTGYVSDAVAVTGLGTATSLTINGAAVNVDISAVSTLESSGLTVGLTFAWGDAFGGKNPETYYTDGSYTGSATVFAATLNAFETAVKGASFTLTLTPVLD